MRKYYTTTVLTSDIKQYAKEHLQLVIYRMLVHDCPYFNVSCIVINDIIITNMHAILIVCMPHSLSTFP